MNNKVTYILEKTKTELELLTGRRVMLHMHYIDKSDPAEFLSIVQQKKGITLAELQSKSRKQSLVYARLSIAKILHEQYDMSYHKIGSLLNRTHSSMLRCKKNTSLGYEKTHQQLFNYYLTIVKMP